mmetsp:Transcript_17753/g.50229  ORF Transcript_17753/g.50229 Transcript_17753/m.50229 type:complete len:349 (+) Transcript_17753:1501-2547(+)
MLGHLGVHVAERGDQRAFGGGGAHCREQRPQRLHARGDGSPGFAVGAPCRGILDLHNIHHLQPQGHLVAVPVAGLLRDERVVHQPLHGADGLRVQRHLRHQAGAVRAAPLEHGNDVPLHGQREHRPERHGGGGTNSRRPRVRVGAREGEQDEGLPAAPSGAAPLAPGEVDEHLPAAARHLVDLREGKDATGLAGRKQRVAAPVEQLAPADLEEPPLPTDGLRKGARQRPAQAARPLRPPPLEQPHGEHRPRRRRRRAAGTCIGDRLGLLRSQGDLPVEGRALRDRAPLGAGICRHAVGGRRLGRLPGRRDRPHAQQGLLHADAPTGRPSATCAAAAAGGRHATGGGSI